MTWLLHASASLARSPWCGKCSVTSYATDSMILLLMAHRHSQLQVQMATLGGTVRCTGSLQIITSQWEAQECLVQNPVLCQTSDPPALVSHWPHWIQRKNIALMHLSYTGQRSDRPMIKPFCLCPLAFHHVSYEQPILMEWTNQHLRSIKTGHSEIFWSIRNLACVCFYNMVSGKAIL